MDESVVKLHTWPKSGLLYCIFGDHTNVNKPRFWVPTVLLEMNRISTLIKVYYLTSEDEEMLEECGIRELMENQCPSIDIITDYSRRQSFMLIDLDIRMDNVKFIFDYRRETKMDPVKLQCLAISQKIISFRKKNRGLLQSYQKMTQTLRKLHKKMKRKYKRLKSYLN